MQSFEEETLVLAVLFPRGERSPSLPLSCSFRGPLGANKRGRALPAVARRHRSFVAKERLSGRSRFRSVWRPSGRRLLRTGGRARPKRPRNDYGIRRRAANAVIP